MVGIDILLCEDERIVAFDIERRIEGLGHVIRGLASTCEDALALARELKPDIAIMDIGLDGAPDGIQTACLLKVELNIPSIFLTSYCDDETVVRALAADPIAYLTKPVNDIELKMAINNGMRFITEKRNRSFTVNQFKSNDLERALPAYQ